MQKHRGFFFYKRYLCAAIRMKFLFLYTEIAEYFLACCNQLAAHGEVHIIRWPVNKEAPFQFAFNGQLKVYDKNDHTFEGLQQLIASIGPSIIVCSGWIDKDYLKLTKAYAGKIPTVMTCDTHWRGDLKQRLATVIGRFYLPRIFSHAWVPGQSQEAYVRRLGFKEQNIETGFYSCDLPHFEALFQKQFPAKKADFPKRFLYVGRYYEFKGIQELWQAFTRLQAEQPCDWELWCLGTGDVEPVSHPKIKHFGFVQPRDLENFTAASGVFILPSRFEPWGVVVHEFAASGFPLLLSNRVGAGGQFLKEGQNGFFFEAENAGSIQAAMKKITSMANAELVQMGEKSNRLSKSISPQTWVNSILKMEGAICTK